MAWWRERAAGMPHRLPDQALGPLLPVLVALRLAADGRAEVRRRAGIGPSLPRGGCRPRRLEATGPSPSTVPAARVRGLATVRPSPASRPSESVHRFFDGDDDGRARSRLWASTEIPDVVIGQLATTVVSGVMQRRSTWTRWNLLAETARATRALRRRASQTGTRCTTGSWQRRCRRACAWRPRSCSPSLRRSDDLTGPRCSPAPVRTPTPTAASSRAEQRLLAALDDLTAPTADVEVAVRVTRGPSRRGGRRVSLVLAGDRSGRRSVRRRDLRAPAMCWSVRPEPGRPRRCARCAPCGRSGTAPVRSSAWPHPRRPHESSPKPWASRARTPRSGCTRPPGPPGRAARRNGPTCRTWPSTPCHGDGLAHRRITGGLHDLEAQSATWALRAGQLLIVDEAWPARSPWTPSPPKPALGAKVLLVGDHQQLSAVDAGGAFGLLAACEPARTCGRCGGSPSGGRPTPPAGCVTATPPSSAPTPSTTGSPPAAPTRSSTPPTTPGPATWPAGRRRCCWPQTPPPSTPSTSAPISTVWRPGRSTRSPRSPPPREPGSGSATWCSPAARSRRLLSDDKQ